MKRLNYYRRIGIAAALFAFCGGAAQAQRFGPDQLQTLGVGSRAVAMGDAYAAIANDPSATFWNPGRLGFLYGRQAMISFRNVDRAFAAQRLIGTAPNQILSPTSASFQSADFQPGFGSFTYPLYGNKIGRGAASIGVSYTLGGYYSLDSDNTLGPDPGAPLQNLKSQTHTIVSNSFLTVAYGAQIAKNLGVGLGVFFLNQDFSKQTRASGLAPNLAVEKGRGYGVNVGICYDTGGTPSQNAAADESGQAGKFLPFYSFALAYRTQASISGLGDQGKGFNEEIPGRFSAGFAIHERFKNDSFKWGKKPQYSEGTFSIEYQLLQAANRSYDSQGLLRLTDARRAVGDLHLGVEYIPGALHKPGAYELPLRFGFRTNSNAATGYTSYDNVVSLGLAYIALDKRDARRFFH